jgi:hypothetical protein
MADEGPQIFRTARGGSTRDNRATASVETRSGDVVRARVEKITPGGAPGAARVATLRMRHAEFKPDRFWSFCDVVVALPETSSPDVLGADTLKSGDDVLVVLAARSEASRTADTLGHYSCRLHAAGKAPEIPIERSTERIYAGLIERSEPPAGGEVVLHLGSGLTCYVELAGDGPYPPESLEHGSWCEFILDEPFAVLVLRRAK